MDAVVCETIFVAVRRSCLPTNRCRWSVPVWGRRTTGCRYPAPGSGCACGPVAVSRTRDRSGRAWHCRESMCRTSARRGQNPGPYSRRGNARDCFWLVVTENEVAKQIVDAAYHVHTSLG